MIHKRNLFLGLLSVLLLSACGQNEESDTVLEETEPEKEMVVEVEEVEVEIEEEEIEEDLIEDQTAAIQAAYQDILDNIESYEFTYPPIGNYIYDLFDMTGDGYPELFVQSFTEDAIADLRVFSWLLDDQELVLPEEVLRVGAASSGGFRAFVSGTKTSNGFFNVSMSAGTGEESIYRVILEEGELVSLLEWEHQWDETIEAFEEEQVDFDWVDIDDRSKIEAIE